MDDKFIRKDAEIVSHPSEISRADAPPPIKPANASPLRFIPRILAAAGAIVAGFFFSAVFAVIIIFVLIAFSILSLLGRKNSFRFFKFPKN